MVKRAGRFARSGPRIPQRNQQTKNMKLPLRHLSAAAFLAVSLPVLAQEPAPAEPKVLSDGANAKFKRVENMH